MILKKLVVLLSAIFISSLISALELQNGIVQEFGMAFTEQQKLALPLVTKEVRRVASDEETRLSLAFINPDNTDIWYRLYDNIHIYGVDVAKARLLGNWPLARWPGELTAEIDALNRREPVTGDIGEYWKDYRYAEPLEELLGCLVSNPLRYGDVGDGRQSLVVVLGAGDEQLDVIVFSPEHGKISLSARVAQQDFMETENEYNENQYSPSYNMRAGWVGLRTYAKIFIGDFNDDGVKEAIVWRKRYVSRLKDDPLRGFRLDDEILSHYKLQEAEYVLQPTDKAKVEGWLAARQLTWQKGYPSKSECPGQENRLIPEMHDPLLNDPDVLH